MPSNCEKQFEELTQQIGKLEQKNNALEKQNREHQTREQKSSGTKQALPSWFSDFMSKVNKLIAGIAKHQECDEECKRKKQLEKYKKQMEYALENENENHINDAQNKYYSLRDGSLQNRMRFSNKYIEIGTKQQQKYRDLKEILSNNIANDKKNLLSFFIAIDNINNVIKFTKNQNKKLRIEIDEMTSNINKNDRKYFYKQQYLKFKSYIKYILSAIFIISCLIYLYLSNIINNFMINKMYYIGVIILMISYLFIVNNIFYYIVK